MKMIINMSRIQKMIWSGLILLAFSLGYYLNYASYEYEKTQIMYAIWHYTENTDNTSMSAQKYSRETLIDHERLILDMSHQKNNNGVIFQFDDNNDLKCSEECTISIDIDKKENLFQVYHIDKSIILKPLDSEVFLQKIQKSHFIGVNIPTFSGKNYYFFDTSTLTEQFKQQLNINQD